ncbi:MAG: 16S rRNA processing protein RimM [Prevotella sp.]|nr:16S rRNA processing protein RimM [Prevotella sp.]
MIKPQQVYPIGRIGKPHGVKGEMNFMFDDDVFDTTDSDYIIIETEGILVPFFFEEYRFRNDNTAIIKLEGIDTQEQAREFTNCVVYFERSKAENAEDETSTFLSQKNRQIVGFTIVDAQTGKSIGTVKDIDGSTINVLLVIEDEDRQQMLIPANEDLIEGIDLQRQTITMRLPDGLLTL